MPNGKSKLWHIHLLEYLWFMQRLKCVYESLQKHGDTLCYKVKIFKNQDIKSLHVIYKPNYAKICTGKWQEGNTPRR